MAKVGGSEMMAEDIPGSAAADPNYNDESIDDDQADDDEMKLIVHI